MKSPRLIVVAALCVAAWPTHAQDLDQTRSILQVLRLPIVTQEARQLGTSDAEIRDIFDMVRQERVPVGVLTETLDEHNKAVREYGPVDNFGAFVQEQLKAGKRGKDLAQAIRAEHAAHGKGKDAIKSAGAMGQARTNEAKSKAEGKMNESSDAAAVQAKGAAKGAAKAAGQTKGKGQGKSGEHGG